MVLEFFRSSEPTGIDAVEWARRMADYGEELNLELDQGPFMYRFKARVESVSMSANIHDMMTARVCFVAQDMEVIEHA